MNIFAKQMVLTVVDQPRGLMYTQTFKDNMTEIGKPTVKPSKHKSYVSVEWTPDFARFGMTEISKEMERLIERRVWDLAMTLGKEIKVSLNGTPVKCKNLTDYAKGFGCDTVLYETPNERWNIAVADSPVDKSFSMSFVNGIWTSKGGTHVDAVTNQVVGHIVDYLETKKKVKVKPSLVKDHLAIFITSMIENRLFQNYWKHNPQRTQKTIPRLMERSSPESQAFQN